MFKKFFMSIVFLFLMAVSSYCNPAQYPLFQVIDADGNPVAGGWVYTYEEGTTTPKIAYTDKNLTIPATNPIELDSKGEALFYLDGFYKIDVKTATGVQVDGFPLDNIADDTTGSIVVDHNVDGTHIIYDSIADLRASTLTPFDGQKITVLGYYAPGDGGGGQFYWSAASVLADNSGTVIKVTSITTGRWFRLYDGPLFVDWFGAKTDGSDNASILQSVIDLVYANGGGSSIKFGKADTYTYGTGLSFPNNDGPKVSFGGQKPSGTVLNYTGSGDAIICGDDTGYLNVSSRKLPIEFSNFKLTTATGVNGIKLEWRFNQGVKCENIYVTGFSGRGFWSKGKAWTNVFINCLSEFNDIGYEINSHANTLMHCDATGNTSYGLVVRRDSDITASVVPSSTVIVGGAYEQSNLAAIYVNGCNGLTFSGYIENGYTGAWTTAPGIIITSDTTYSGAPADCVGMSFAGYSGNGSYTGGAIEINNTIGVTRGLNIVGMSFVGTLLTDIINHTGNNMFGVSFTGNEYPATANICNDMSQITMYTDADSQGVEFAGKVTTASLESGVARIGESDEIDVVDGPGISVTPSFASGNAYMVTVTVGNNFSILSPAGAQNGARLVIDVYNNSGVILGLITWGSLYKFASTWTNPADGFHRTVEFTYIKGAWRETGGSGGDLPD